MKQKMQKNQKHKRPLHLHLEYFFRLRVCLIVAAVLLLLALVRSDQEMLSAMPQAYAEGAGIIGSYMSEERLHPHAQVNTLRVVTVSSGS